MRRPPEFCDECDLTLDLHPQPYDEDDPGCDSAESKARLLDMWNTILGRVTQ